MECLAYAAHELRTPLAAQRALLELALADDNTDAPTWREIGQDVLAACRQQERVLEACLTLARSRNGRQRSEEIDLAAVAAEALGAHDLNRLECVVAFEPARTTGDQHLVERLTANLVSNAIHHNVAGGSIELATRTESGFAHLTVANTGPVVPAAELERLFEPFHRLDAHSTVGLGLGLAIVQTVADAHDAAVTAQTRADGGLCVDVAFPALD